ncbi:hypothetical protein [Paraglaciecola arctica]|uniref:Lipoprotein n=1 Tax=Paraglaciecola arctica BSs20135 TaxID=493475 RepID=K6YPY3_9ALTE|nr:hypothetical protein [Paraglaciecola arctica]GAC18703.1 hypothetical protein GARC_1731 [Paraglaciecola arctica BSs20135]
MKKTMIICVVFLPFLMQGCTTSTYVKLPENSIMKIKRGQEVSYQEGKVTRSPLSWSSAAGIPYKIEKDGKVIKEGKMRSKFRPVSIFWPPVGMAYWPMGFRTNCNDLTIEYPHKCSEKVLKELKPKN